MSASCTQADFPLGGVTASCRYSLERIMSKMLCRVGLQIPDPPINSSSALSIALSNLLELQNMSEDRGVASCLIVQQHQPGEAHSVRHACQ